MEQMRLNG